MCASMVLMCASTYACPDDCMRQVCAPMDAVCVPVGADVCARVPVGPDECMSAGVYARAC